MDATVPEKKLDFNKFRHKLYGENAGIFEFSGKIKKYGRFLESSLPGFHQSNLYIYGVTGFTENLLQPKFIIINDFNVVNI